MHQSIIFACAALLVFAATFLVKKTSDKTAEVLIKSLTVLFCAVGFFRLMLSDSFTFVINGGYYDEIYYDATDPMQTILRWGYYLNYAVLPMTVFFSSRLFRNIACYVCLPFSLLSVVFYNDFMYYFLDETGRGLHMTSWFRYAYFAFELILAISVPIIMAIKEKHLFKFKDLHEWMNFLIATPLIIILMIPVYAPQSLFGYSKMLAKQGSVYHFGWLAIVLIVTLALYYLFRFRRYNDRYMLVVFLTIVLFFHYDSLYLMGFSIPRLPIQLCNLAAYFYMIAIIGRLQKMFQFCFIANVTGAIIAMILPDFLPGAFGFWNMHFVLEHSLVFIIPLLATGLRIFPRVEIKSLKYTWIGFSAYFIFCLVSGMILNGYSKETGFEVNYFFLFDLDKAFDIFPFLTFAENFCIRFGRFYFYPIFVSIIYVAFMVMCFVYYAVVRFLYKVEDDHLQLRLSAIDLYEKLTKKTSRAPKEFVD